MRDAAQLVVLELLIFGGRLLLRVSTCQVAGDAHQQQRRRQAARQCAGACCCAAPLLGWWMRDPKYALFICLFVGADVGR